MKGLELLKTYEDKYTFASQFNGDRLADCQTRKMLEPIKKELKALEIIRQHKLLNYILKNEKCAKMYHLSKEQLELLKEVMQ